VRRFTTMAAAALVALMSGGLAAQQPPAKPPSSPATLAPGAKEESATGKIVKFDATSRTLTLQTAKGEERFMLASNAKLNEGSRTLTAADLGGAVGQEAKVRYTTAGGQKTAMAVMVSRSSTSSPSAPAGRTPAKPPPAPEKPPQK
jgi:hypothetical protein